MKITFNSEEVKSAFVCKLHDLGLHNVDPNTVSVSIKSIRDGSGGSEAEVEFQTLELNTSLSIGGEDPKDTATEHDNTEAPVDTDNGTSEAVSNIFNK